MKVKLNDCKKITYRFWFIDPKNPWSNFIQNHFFVKNSLSLTKKSTSKVSRITYRFGFKYTNSFYLIWLSLQSREKMLHLALLFLLMHISSEPLQAVTSRCRVEQSYLKWHYTSVYQSSDSFFYLQRILSLIPTRYLNHLTDWFLSRKKI
jgi:hypothetical protein